MKIKFYLTCIFLCVIYTTKAQDADSLNQAGARLFAEKHYFEAAIQYERALFMSKDASSGFHSVIGKVQCLKQQHLFTEAARFINANRNASFGDSLNYLLYYEQVLCAYLSGNFANCLAVIEQTKLYLPLQSKDISIDILKILSLNELRRWNEAREEYNAYIQKCTSSPNLENLYTNLPALKSVDKASWLSTFIPGAGQMYAGKPLEGILSIIIQGAGLYYGIWSFKEKYYLSAWLVGAGIFGTFHMGGVRRSEVLVNQYNNKKAFEFNSRVKSQLVGTLQ